MLDVTPENAISSLTENIHVEDGNQSVPYFSVSISTELREQSRADLLALVAHSHR